MHKRVYKILTTNSIIFDLQFGSRENFSTAHALKSLTEKIRRALDERYIGYRILVELQKHLIQLIMKFFQQNVIIMVFVVFK